MHLDAYRDAAATRGMGVKAFITGGTGFVGPHLVAHLDAEGDDVVLAPDERTGFSITDRDAVMHELDARQARRRCITSRRGRMSPTRGAIPRGSCASTSKAPST